ncbi:MAG: response regulator transcription factor [Alphaproteobacteria bacterium]|nr:response regulator transcription factor [Alphaproteobacteria bacterium]
MAIADEPVILVVEDERQVRLLLSRVLTAAGFATTVVATAADARQIIGGLKPNLVVLDLGLPGEDGLSLGSWISKRYPGTGLLILTGQSAPADRVKGLDSGADDYVVKPFMNDELVARIRSILRRLSVVEKPVAEEPILAFLDAVLDPDQSGLRWNDGRILHLTVIEFAILAAIVEKPGRAVSRTTLLDRIGANDDVGARSVDYHVCQLRAKLKNAGIAADSIDTVRGIGYIYHPARETPGQGTNNIQTFDA